GQGTLRLTDPWQQKEQWVKRFSPEVKIWPVGVEAVAVMHRDGRFLLVSLPEGQITIDEKVEPEPNLHEIFFIRTPNRDLLITNRQLQNRNGITVTPVPGGPGSPTVNGNVHGFDRATGKRIFTRRVEHQGL